MILRPSTEPSATIGKSRWYQRAFGRVAVKHLVNFCRQFASYLDAGINLYRAIESLRRQYEWTVARAGDRATPTRGASGPEFDRRDEPRARRV